MSSTNRAVQKAIRRAIRRVLNGPRPVKWTISDSNVAMAKRRKARAIVKFRPRQPLPPAPPVEPTVPKLPPGGPAIHPKPLRPIPPPPSSAMTAQTSSATSGGAHHPVGSVARASAVKTSTSATASTTGKSSGSQSGAFTSRIKEWLRANAAVLILNFGSVCTLAGFTRKDVLELRILSMTGSLSSIIYFTTLSPRAWVPMAWSSIFALTNAYNIHAILDERSHRVELTDEEEEIFVEHFMPHGVTPKQFKKVINRASVVQLPKNQKLHSQGEVINHVFLVVKGHTRASVLGRYMTAASSQPGNSVTKRGGDSGAWIGEMVFLEKYWDQHHPPSAKAIKKYSSRKRNEVIDEGDEGSEDENDPEVKEDEAKTNESSKYRALYTITAKDDCELLQWSHEELDKILSSSTDMRSAMTRAMTAAVVGKVVNFTLSRTSESSPWSSWLKDWKMSGGASINVRSEIGGGGVVGLRRSTPERGGKSEEVAQSIDAARKQIEQLTTDI